MIFLCQSVVMCASNTNPPYVCMQEGLNILMPFFLSLSLCCEQLALYLSAMTLYLCCALSRGTTQIFKDACKFVNTLRCEQGVNKV